MRTIKELLRELNDASNKLEAGDLHVSELSDLTDVSRELYERLITLRYAAMEKEVKQDIQPEKKEPFRLKPTIHPGQTSLIDAIEEVDGLSIDEAEAEEIQQEEQQQEQEGVEQEEQQQELVQQEQESVEQESVEQESVEQDAQTLFPPEATAPTEAASLAEKLSRTPIADLRKAIGLNTKFQLIKVYFEGDASKYDEVIDAINGAPSLENAMETFTSSTNQFGDEEHVELEEQLIDLIERRFL